MAEPTVVLLFDFDGTLYDGDLPVLSYARHTAEQLDPVRAAGVIDGIRSFLEDRSLGLSAVDLSTAQDGHQAVEMLAAAAGVAPQVVAAAYRASRADLAASAFAVDPPAGLVDLLARLGDRAYVAVVTNASPAGVREVLDSTGLLPFVHEMVTDAGKPASLPALVARLLARIGGPSQAARLLAAGDRWSADLEPAHRIGGATAYIDRFGRGDGTPTWRAAELAAVVPEIERWAAQHLATAVARPAQ